MPPSPPRATLGLAVSVETVAHDAVQVLASRGLINLQLREQLLSERPFKRSHIDAVLAPILQGQLHAKDVAASVQKVDRLYDQMRHVIEGQPPDPRGPSPWRVVVSHEAGDLITKQNGAVLQRVSRAELAKLPPEQAHLIRTYERSMDRHFKVWSRRYPNLAAASSPSEADAIRDDLRARVRAMADDLDAILDFLTSCGLHLDDHYLHIRALVRQA